MFISLKSLIGPPFLLYISPYTIRIVLNYFQIFSMNSIIKYSKYSGNGTKEHSSLIPNIIIMRETVAITYKNSPKKQPQQLFQLFTNFLYGEYKISYRVCAGYYTNSNSSRTESHNNVKVEKRQYLTLTTQNCQLTLKKAIFDICARKRISNANNNEEHTCEWRKTTENLRWIWEQEEYILYRYVAYVLICKYNKEYIMFRRNLICH